MKKYSSNIDISKISYKSIFGFSTSDFLFIEEGTIGYIATFNYLIWSEIITEEVQIPENKNAV